VAAQVRPSIAATVSNFKLNRQVAALNQSEQSYRHYFFTDVDREDSSFWPGWVYREIRKGSPDRGR